jgi:transcriptional regulator with XRE-family HTH domain
MTETADRRRGQKLRGNPTEWSQMRLAANLSVSELAERSGVARSLVGLIDQGRLMPTARQAKALLDVLSGPETL